MGHTSHFQKLEEDIQRPKSSSLTILAFVKIAPLGDTLLTFIDFFS